MDESEEDEGSEKEYEELSEEDSEESASNGSARLVWHDAYAQQYPELFRDDVSIYPSYTQFKLPYPVICRQRYQAARKRYCRRLKLELLIMEMTQQRAIDGVRMRRVMSSGLRMGRHHFRDPLNHKERRHLEDLLNTRKLFEG